LCPNYCIIHEKYSGKCRKRVNIKNILYTENYAETISLTLDPMKKKPLYHFHRVESSSDNVLSLGANSCNLSCKYCQNYSSSQQDCTTKNVSPELLLAICLEQSIKHVAFTYTEPFTWYEYIFDSAKILNKNGISVILVTNGYVNINPLKDIIPFVSAMNIDLKSFSDGFYIDICGGKLKPVLDTIEFSHSKTHIEITLLLIENMNNDTKELNMLFSFISRLDKNIPLHILKYFPRYQMNMAETNETTIYNTVNMAKKYLNNVYAGNVKY